MDAEFRVPVSGSRRKDEERGLRPTETCLGNKQTLSASCSGDSRNRLRAIFDAGQCRNASGDQTFWRNTQLGEMRDGKHQSSNRRTGRFITAKPVSRELGGSFSQSLVFDLLTVAWLYPTTERSNDACPTIPVHGV